DSRFDVVTRPQLSTLVFRYAPSEAPDAAADSTTAHAMNSAMDGAMDCVVDAAALDRANEYARDELAGSGEAVVASTVADGRTHLKFTLLNPRTTLGDVEQILDLLAGHAQHYLTTTAGTTRDSTGSLHCPIPMITSQSFSTRSHCVTYFCTCLYKNFWEC